MDRSARAGHFISILTLGEPERGILALDEGAKRRRLTRWLEELEDNFARRTLPVDRRVMCAWAEISARADRMGRRLPAFDSLLTATAMVHDLTIITRNVRDFPSEVRTFDPWG